MEPNLSELDKDASIESINNKECNYVEIYQINATIDIPST